jgi:uncharacterized protein (DUF952 family)
MMDESCFIVHICSEAAWANAESEGQYVADSLEVERFIHCSRPEQVLKVANHFYPKMSNLVLLWIDTRLLSAELRWELSDGEVYPHLYGPLNIVAVVGVFEFAPDRDGVFRNLPDYNQILPN